MSEQKHANQQVIAALVEALEKFIVVTRKVRTSFWDIYEDDEQFTSNLCTDAIEQTAVVTVEARAALALARGEEK
jgi:hypothetical protein